MGLGTCRMRENTKPGRPLAAGVSVLVHGSSAVFLF